MKKKTRPIQSLVQAIVSTREKSQYAFFLGAGCSTSSGVRLASQLIKEWRARLFIIDHASSLPVERPTGDYLVLAIACSHHNLDWIQSNVERGHTDRLLPNQLVRIRLHASIFGVKANIQNFLNEPNFVDRRHEYVSTDTKIFTDSVPTEEGVVFFALDEALRLNDAFQTWLKVQNWYGRADEYSVLFERIFSLPAQRQAFIESEVEYARPYWGYLYLADMMNRGLFNVVFTTNFDDLLNDAFTRFVADSKPIVCAHDSLVSQIRITSKRPKIIKLHGDFLYESIKNTTSELKNMDQNMRAKLEQFSKEVGLVVVGYSGNDLSVMTVLLELIEDALAFPFGIHWCVRNREQITSKLALKLLKHERVFLYEIPGFDGMMASFHEAFKLELPQFAANPLQVISSQIEICSRIISGYEHPLIKQHTEELNKSIDHLLLEDS